MECSKPGQILLARTRAACMMHKTVRAMLIEGRSSLGHPVRRLRPALLLLAALGLQLLAGQGCVGGQSGAEDFCGENKRDTNNPFATESTDDEDSGVEDDDGGAPNELVSDNGPEVQSGPEQCPPPGDGEY